MPKPKVVADDGDPLLLPVLITGAGGKREKEGASKGGKAPFHWAAFFPYFLW